MTKKNINYNTPIKKSISAFLIRKNPKETRPDALPFHHQNTKKSSLKNFFNKFLPYKRQRRTTLPNSLDNKLIQQKRLSRSLPTFESIKNKKIDSQLVLSNKKKKRLSQQFAELHQRKILQKTPVTQKQKNHFLNAITKNPRQALEMLNNNSEYSKIIDTFDGANSFHILVQNFKNEDAEIALFKKLLECNPQGASEQNIAGKTPRMIAQQNTLHKETLENLLSKAKRISKVLIFKRIAKASKRDKHSTFITCIKKGWIQEAYSILKENPKCAQEIDPITNNTPLHFIIKNYSGTPAENNLLQLCTKSYTHALSLKDKEGNTPADCATTHQDAQSLLKILKN